MNGLFAGKARRFKSKPYKGWIERAGLMASPQAHVRFDGPVRLTIGLGAPDKRRRDVSNYIKAPEDFMVRSAVLADDSQVMDVRAYWASDVENGCRIEIEALDYMETSNVASKQKVIHREPPTTRV